jgi:hypothetical protein
VASNLATDARSADRYRHRVQDRPGIGDGTRAFGKGLEPETFTAAATVVDDDPIKQWDALSTSRVLSRAQVPFSPPSSNTKEVESQLADHLVE